MLAVEEKPLNLDLKKTVDLGEWGIESIERLGSESVFESIFMS